MHSTSSLLPVESHTMDLPRSGGPGEGPSIDPELQRQLELQRELEQQRQQELIKPTLSVELDQYINQRPDLQEHLKQFRPEEQNALKQAIVDSAARFAPDASIEYVQVGKEDGKLYVQAGKYYLGVVDPEKALAEFPEQQPIFGVPTQEITQQERLPTREQEEGDQHKHLSGLSSSPYRGHSSPSPIRLPQEMTPERGSHLPERLHEIGQQVEQHIGDQLKAYSPEQQTQLTQALTREISDFAGWEPQIRQINKDENGLLHVLYNKTGEITLNPQEILQPQITPHRELAQDNPQSLQFASLRQHTEQQLGQHLDGYNALERLVLTNTLTQQAMEQQGSIQSIARQDDGSLLVSLDNEQTFSLQPQQIVASLYQSDSRDDLDWTARREEQATAERLAMMEGQSRQVNEVGTPQGERYSKIPWAFKPATRTEQQKQEDASSMTSGSIFGSRTRSLAGLSDYKDQHSMVNKVMRETDQRAKTRELERQSALKRPHVINDPPLNEVHPEFLIPAFWGRAAPAVMTAKLAGAGIGAGANIGVQMAMRDENEKIDYASAGIAGLTGWMSAGANLPGTMIIGGTGAYTIAASRGEDPTGATTAAVAGSMIGYGIGTKLVEKPLGNVFNPIRNQYTFVQHPQYNWAFTQMPVSPIPSLSGNFFGAITSEAGGASVQKIIEKVEKNNGKE